MNPPDNIVPDPWPEMTDRIEARRRLIAAVTGAIQKGRTYHFRFRSNHPQDKQGVQGRVIRWSEGNDDTEPYVTVETNLGNRHIYMQTITAINQAVYQPSLFEEGADHD